MKTKQIQAGTFSTSTSVFHSSGKSEENSGRQTFASTYTEAQRQRYAGYVAPAFVLCSLLTFFVVVMYNAITRL